MKSMKPIDHLKRALILVVLFLAGCCPSIHNEADKARYEAIRPAYTELAVGAVAAGTLKAEDAEAMGRLFDAWKLDIEARGVSK